MKRIHVNLRVRDLDKSIRTYSKLFDSEPTVRKSDYAKWMLDDPRINLAITQSSDQFGVEHLGIQAESRAELSELRERLAGIDAEVFDEGETACCYSLSDKTWFVDEQKVAWELFFTHGQSDQLAPVAVAGKSPCCAEQESPCC